MTPFGRAKALTASLGLACIAACGGSGSPPLPEIHSNGSPTSQASPHLVADMVPPRVAGFGQIASATSDGGARACPARLPDDCASNPNCHRGVSGGSTQWANTIGGPNQAWLQPIIAAPSGGLVTAGPYSPNAPNGLPSNQDAAAYVAELDSGGRLTWALLLGSSTETVTVGGLALLPDGTIDVMGTFTGPGGFAAPNGLAPSAPPNSSGLFGIALTQDGTPLHAFIKLSSPFDWSPVGTGISVTGAAGGLGGAAVAGVFSGTADFGAGPVTSSEWTAYAALYRSDLTLAWLQTFPTWQPPSSQGPPVFAVKSVQQGASGQTVLAYSGPSNYPAPSEQPGTVSVIAADGTVQFTRSGFLDSWSLQGWAATVGSDGEVYVADVVSAIYPFTFAGQTLTSSGPDQLFLAALTPSGVDDWIRILPTSLQDPEVYPTSLAQMPNGNFVLSGVGAALQDLGLGQMSSQGTNYVGFLLELDASGTPLWSRVFENGAGGMAFPSDVTVSACGNVLVSGWAGGIVDFGLGVQDVCTNCGMVLTLSP
jgi:hypothetical protein